MEVRSVVYPLVHLLEEHPVLKLAVFPVSILSEEQSEYWASVEDWEAAVVEMDLDQAVDWEAVASAEESLVYEDPDAV